jgi:hypothetical protein
MMVWRRDETKVGEVKTSDSLRKQALRVNCPLYLYFLRERGSRSSTQPDAGLCDRQWGGRDQH